MIPFRNDNHVVGLLTCCDDCKDELYGQRFDREVKFKKLTRPTVSEGEIEEEILNHAAGTWDNNGTLRADEVDVKGLILAIKELLNR
jgi:hypothetical protein